MCLSALHHQGDKLLPLRVQVADQLLQVSVNVRPPVPEALQLSALGLGPDVLPTMADEIFGRLGQVNSLLDTGTGAVVNRSAFPARDWEA